MKIFTGVIAALLMAFAISCKTTKKPQAGTTSTSDSTAVAAAPNRDTITDLSAKKIMKDKEIYAAVTETIKMDTAYLEGSVLHIYTRKINACDAHKFKLLWNGAMSKSLPPQASTRLFLLNDTQCKEQHYFHLTYDISSVKMPQDSATSGATVIKVSGWGRAMKYEYTVPEKK